jgi:hypothetical protein
MQLYVTLLIGHASKRAALVCSCAASDDAVRNAALTTLREALNLNIDLTELKFLIDSKRRDPNGPANRWIRPQQHLI